MRRAFAPTRRCEACGKPRTPPASLSLLLRIQSTYSVSEALTLYPRHLLRIRCAGFVCATPALYPKPIRPPHTQRLICTFPFCPGGEALESQLRCPPHPPFRFRPSSVLHSMQRRAFAPTWAHTPLFRFCKFPILASRSCCFHAKHFPLLFLYVPSLISCFRNTPFPANRTWHLSRRELCCRRHTYDEGGSALNAARELHLAIPAAKGIGAKANRG